MSYVTLQNTPLTIDLQEAAKDTGWTLLNNKAIHSACNAGSIILNDLNLTEGATYQFSINVESISGGYLQAFLGDSGTPHITSAGYYNGTATIVDGQVLRFYSDANCVISDFNARQVGTALGNKATNTIIFSERVNKWTSFFTFVPDVATSLFTNLYSFKNGTAYNHLHQLDNRNEFYDSQYQSIFRFVENKTPTLVKSYNSIAYQGNQLMVTSEDGITTSLGQVSELADEDFIKATLASGITSLTIYAQEGIYSASFLRDKNIDLINGDTLKGNWIDIELITVDGNVPLNLYSIAVNNSISKIGVR